MIWQSVIGKLQDTLRLVNSYTFQSCLLLVCNKGSMLKHFQSPRPSHVNPDDSTMTSSGVIFSYLIKQINQKNHRRHHPTFSTSKVAFPVTGKLTLISKIVVMLWNWQNVTLYLSYKWHICHYCIFILQTCLCSIFIPYFAIHYAY